MAWGVSLTPLPRLPPVLIGHESGWAAEPVWTQGLEEKSFASAGDRTSIARSSSPYPDTILTELPGSVYWLISAGMKFRNKKKFRYGIPAYTVPCRALHTHTHTHYVSSTQSCMYIVPLTQAMQNTEQNVCDCKWVPQKSRSYTNQWNTIQYKSDIPTSTTYFVVPWHNLELLLTAPSRLVSIPGPGMKSELIPFSFLGCNFLQH
jgi:hypothetical protein